MKKILFLLLFLNPMFLFASEFDGEYTPQPQLLKLKKLSQNIRLTIIEVYRGSKFDDTCISGIFSDVKLIREFHD